MTSKICFKIIIFTIVATMTGSCIECDETVTKRQFDEIVTRVISIDNDSSAILDISTEEFQKKGYEFGDIVNINLNDSLLFENIPYFDGYYVREGELILCSYKNESITKITRNHHFFAKDYKCKVGDKIVIQMEQKAVMLEEEEMLSFDHSNNREDFTSDESFANAREVLIGDIHPNRLYRSVSPFDNSLNRADFASKYIKEQGISTILTLSDDSTSIEKNTNDLSDYSRQLLSEGKVIASQLSTAYTEDCFILKLGEGFTKMVAKPTPYIICCQKGDDHVGFACTLLEALGGASYQEMEEDYMKSYENYYFIDRKNTRTQYDLLVELDFLGILQFITGQYHVVNISRAKFSTYAAKFLKENMKMTDKDIELLKQKLTE